MKYIRSFIALILPEMVLDLLAHVQASIKNLNIGQFSYIQIHKFE